MPVVNYTTVNGRILHEDRNGVKTLFMPDTLGNVIETRNMDTGAQTSSTTYWPYGEVRTQTGTNPSPFGFCGVWGYYTQAGQPTYVRARYYRPNLGRWQTVDPLWPSEDAYLYGINSPVALIDPSGEKVYICKGLIGTLPWGFGDINHWSLIIDGPHCAKIRIEFSHDGILIGQRKPPQPLKPGEMPKKLPPERHDKGKGDKCFEIPLPPGVEECLCKTANEFRIGTDEDILNGLPWKPSTGPKIGPVGPIFGNPNVGEYHFLERNCQHFVITMIGRCGGPWIPDERSRIIGGSPLWRPPSPPSRRI